MARRTTASINGSTPKPRTRKFVEDLPVKLSASEYEKKAEALAGAIVNVASLTAQKKIATKGWSDRITAATLEQEKLRACVETHSEPRTVDCIEETDFAHNKLVVRRLDTGEVVRERALEAEERDRLAQGDLPGTDGEDGDDAQPGA